MGSIRMPETEKQLRALLGMAYGYGGKDCMTIAIDALVKTNDPNSLIDAMDMDTIRQGSEKAIDAIFNTIRIVDEVKNNLSNDDIPNKL